MSALAPAGAASLSVQHRANAMLARIGWALTAVEIDTETGRLRVWAKRDDGREVTLDARPGRATLTCEQIELYSVPFGRRGDRSVVERLRAVFLGRHIIGTGARSGLRGLAHYIDDNPIGDRRLVGRNALALLAGVAP